MPQHIQLEKVIFHTVVFKMGSNRVAVSSIGRMLNRAEIFDFHIVRHNHQSTGVLPRGAAHAHDSLRQTVFLCPARRKAALFQEFAYIAVGCLVGQRTNSSGAKHLGFAEHLDGMTVRFGLVLSRKIQIDVRHFVAAKPQERFKWNIKAIFHIRRSTLRAHLIRHIGATAIRTIQNKLAMLTFGAAVMRRQRVNFRNPGHIRHQRRSNRTTGAHQITIFQRTLYQLLC